MEPHQFMSVMQMIGFAMGRIDSIQKTYRKDSAFYEELEEISDALVDISNYIKHCALCPCEEHEEHEPAELDDEL